MTKEEIELGMTIGDLEWENKAIRARNQRLELELLAVTEERDTAIKAYRELLLKYDSIEARTQK